MIIGISRKGGPTALLQIPVGVGLRKLTAYTHEQEVLGTPRHAQQAPDSFFPFTTCLTGASWALPLSSNSVYNLVIELNLLSLLDGSAGVLAVASPTMHLVSASN